MFTPTNLETVINKIELAHNYPALADILIDSDDVDKYESVVSIGTDCAFIHIGADFVDVDHLDMDDFETVRGVAKDDPSFFAVFAMEQARITAIVTIINNSTPVTSKLVLTPSPLQPTSPTIAQ